MAEAATPPKGTKRNRLQDLAERVEDSVTDTDDEAPPPTKKPRKKKDFRFKGKKVFVTVSQVDWPPKAFADAIFAQYPSKVIKIYAVQEQHKLDASEPVDPERPMTHIHAYLECVNGAFDFTSNKILGKPANFKPIKGAQGQTNTIQYMKKEPDAPFWTNISFSDLKSFATLPEFVDAFAEKYGELRSVINYTQLAAYFAFTQRVEDSLAYSEFERWHKGWEVIPSVQVSVIERWVERARAAEQGDRLPILVVVGPTYIGKTVTMRLLTNPDALYHRGMWNLKTLNRWFGSRVQPSRRAKFLILDDLTESQAGSSTTAPLKAWCQGPGAPYSLTGKYCPVEDLVASATIIITNDLPAWTQEAYWQTNAVVVELPNRKMFRPRLIPLPSAAAPGSESVAFGSAVPVVTTPPTSSVFSFPELMTSLSPTIPTTTSPRPTESDDVIRWSPSFLPYEAYRSLGDQEPEEEW